MEGIIEETIVRQAGGKFHLTSLLQKRLREYLVEGPTKSAKADRILSILLRITKLP